MHHPVDQDGSRHHCTASVATRGPGRAGRVVRPLLLLALSWLLWWGAPMAVADSELGHRGEVGRHRLADMYDSPGAVCDVVRPGPESLGGTWLRVNPPIMFARDRTAAVDEQMVGWRATISALDERTQTWRVVRRGDIVRDLASDDLASYFDGQGWLAEFPVSLATYAASVEMFWYDPLDPGQVEGQAIHSVEHFMVILRYNGEASHGRTAAVCRAPR